MTSVILKKDSLSPMKNFLENIDETIESISFIGKEKESNILINVVLSSQQKLSERGLKKVSLSFTADIEELSEDVNFKINESPENIVSFILASFALNEKLKFLSTPSKETAKFIYGDISFVTKVEYGNTMKISSECTPILSFTKGEFVNHFMNTVGISTSMEWFNKKISGINLVCNDTGAYTMVGTKAFYFKKDFTVGTFHRENSKPFIHDSGIILLKDEVIDLVISETKEDERVKICIEDAVTSDEMSVNYKISIGDRAVFQFECIARKKVKDIVTSNVIPFETATPSNTLEVPTNNFKKFLLAFKNNPMFLNEVVNLEFNSEKGVLNIKPVDSANISFEYAISNCKIKKDTSFFLNFFVLENIISKSNSEMITFFEKKENTNRVIISDGENNFIVGKTVKQQ